MEAPLSKAIFEVLRRNALFYRQAPADPKVYHIDLATIQQLAGQILQTIVVPALAAGAGAVVTEYIKSKFKKDKDKSLTTDDFIKIWEAVSSNIPRQNNPVVQVTVKLEHHGWPKEEAEADAIEVVKIAIEHDLARSSDRSSE